MKLIKIYQQNYYFGKIAKRGLAKKFSTKFSDQFYESLDDIYQNKTYGEILKEVSTTGCCYFYALLLAKNIKNSTLVFGVLEKLNSSRNGDYLVEFEHAWVENDGKVYDTTSKQIFDKVFYVKNYGAVAKRTISYDEVCRNFTKLAKDASKDKYDLKELLEIIEKQSKLDNSSKAEKEIEKTM